MTDQRPSAPLAGRVVLVAGASSGIGRATATAVAALGANVAVAARRGAALAELAAELRQSGQRALDVPADLVGLDAAMSAVERVVTEFGGLDAVVNCVGTNIVHRSLDVLTESGWRELQSANVDAAFALTKAVVPALRRRGGGVLIHVSSSAAKRPDLSGVGYQAAKAAVAAMAHAAMEEVRDDGIRVTVVYPGFTDTPLIAKRPTPPSAEQRAKALHPDDVAAMIAAVLQLPARAYVPEVLISPARS